MKDTRKLNFLNKKKIKCLNDMKINIRDVLSVFCYYLHLSKNLIKK